MNSKTTPFQFSDDFVEDFFRLLVWRRDVRRFETSPIPEEKILKLLESIRLSPSVGLSEPWRIVSVESPLARKAAKLSFQKANASAGQTYESAEREEYIRLKLAGMDEAPVQWAFYADLSTTKGRGLGIQSMPEMLEYSVVTAIQNLWLAARAMQIGVGWVSILEPQELDQICEVPPDWKLIAYLCIGYASEDSENPELEKARWETRNRETIVWKRV